MAKYEFEVMMSQGGQCTIQADELVSSPDKGLLLVSRNEQKVEIVAWLSQTETKWVRRKEPSSD